MSERIDGPGFRVRDRIFGEQRDGPVVSIAYRPGWELVWSDEFSTPGRPDPAKWSIQTGPASWPEVQHYIDDPEHVRVEGGHLVLGSRRGYQGHDYTTARVTSEGKADWTYGRIEVRALLPTGNGIWPSIWMLSSAHESLGWPACGEIDIMEYLGRQPERIHGTVHTKAFNHMRKNARGGNLDLTDLPHRSFHVYAVEWFPDRIDFYVDSTNYFTFFNTGNGSAEWPFDQPQYLIIKLALGGWGGKIDDSIFPLQMLVDYVRVYSARP